MKKKLVKKYKKKKGFTLIELLAVILILGIIALIAIPTVTSVVREARINSNLQTARTYEKAAMDKCSVELIKVEAESEEFELSIFEDYIKNKASADGTITLTKDCRTGLQMLFNNTPDICYYKDTESGDVSYKELEDGEECIAVVNDQPELEPEPEFEPNPDTSNLEYEKETTVNYYTYSPALEKKEITASTTFKYLTAYPGESYSPTYITSYSAEVSKTVYDATINTTTRSYCAWAKEFGDWQGDPSQYYGYLYCGNERICLYYNNGVYYDCNAANAACTCETKTYSCPNGGTLEGNQCIKTTYSCPNGGKLNGKTCNLSESEKNATCPKGGTYNSSKGQCVSSSYSCPSDLKLQENQHLYYGRVTTKNIMGKTQYQCEVKYYVCNKNYTMMPKNGGWICVGTVSTCPKGGTLKTIDGQKVCYVTLDEVN